MTLRFAILALGLASASFGLAQFPPETGAAPDTVNRLAPEELETLVAPIALHPDALIALVLPASTHPTDIVLAARRLAANADLSSLEAEPWDDSVKALAHYPDMLNWMDQNLDWTRQLGSVFVAQPAEVMNAIQRLRTQARANGTLVDTPQQEVVVAEEHIRIVPARPDVIYVPRYDPAIVYVSRPHPHPLNFFSFSIGYAVGSWLAYDFDWPRRTFWIVPPPHRVSYWHERRDWRAPHYHPSKPGYRDHRWHTWHPRTSPTRSSYVESRRPSYSPPRPSHYAPNLRLPSSRPDAGRSTREVTPPRRDGFTSSHAVRTPGSLWGPSQTQIHRTVRPAPDRQRYTPPVTSRISPSRAAPQARSVSQSGPPPPRPESNAHRDSRSRPSAVQWNTDHLETNWRAEAMSPSRTSNRSPETTRVRPGSNGSNEGNRSYSSRSSSEPRPSAHRNATSRFGSQGNAESGRGAHSRR